MIEENVQYLKPPTIPKKVRKELGGLFPHEVAVSILYNRGIRSKKDLEKKLTPSSYIKYDSFKNIKKALTLVRKHLKADSKIAIYGDYDADGVLAISIVWDFLWRKLNYKNVVVYIPSRWEEGYGLNDSALKKLKQGGVKLVITVDCGITSSGLIKTWEKQGLDFIVTDHHEIPATLPDAVTIHPELAQPKFPFPTSGTNIAAKFITGLAEYLGVATLKDVVNHYVDRIGLSIITDVMPLLGENRLLVKEALKKLSTEPNIGLEALYEVAKGVNPKINPPTVYDLGFILGPRLNAAGRLKDPMDALRLLSTQKKEFARAIASKLDALNQERQKMTKDGVQQAIERLHIVSDQIAVAYHPEWEEGVIGLIASHLVKRLKIPALVLTRSNTNKWKGSARSPEEFHITEFLKSIKEQFTNVGGHAQAAGFTLSTDPQTLIQRIQEQVGKLNAHNKNPRPKSIVQLDYITSAKEINRELVESIETLKPFGAGYPSPRILIYGKIRDLYTDKNFKHTFLLLEGQIKASLWNNLEPAFNLDVNDSVYILGTPRFSSYDGNIEIKVDQIFSRNPLESQSANL